VVGYSHLTDETPSHSTRLSKNDNQVAGYRLANGARQVIGYKSPAEELLAGHPKDGDISRWLTVAKRLVIEVCHKLDFA
jgi:hypothetical protein